MIVGARQGGLGTSETESPGISMHNSLLEFAENGAKNKILVCSSSVGKNA